MPVNELIFFPSIKLNPQLQCNLSAEITNNGKRMQQGHKLSKAKNQKIELHLKSTYTELE
jgi:hypothetical protein